MGLVTFFFFLIYINSVSYFGCSLHLQACSVCKFATVIVLDFFFSHPFEYIYKLFEITLRSFKSILLFLVHKKLW
jgi:hypothetical protein